MKITCPNCTTQFRINSEALGLVGRKVKCSKCDFSWHQNPDLDDLVQEPANEPAPSMDSATEPDQPDSEPPVEAPSPTDMGDAPPIPEVEDDFGLRPRRHRRPAKPPPKSHGALIGWSVLGVITVAFVTGFILLRQTIVDAWPPAIQFYELAGLDVKVRFYGLELRNLNSSQSYEGDVPTLTITGEVVNISEQTQSVPQVRVGLINAAGREIYHWTFMGPESELLPEGVSTFSTTLASPPEQAKQLAVTFVEG